MFSLRLFPILCGSCLACLLLFISNTLLRRTLRCSTPWSPRSLRMGLAHQASLIASHTAFLTLKHRQFYLSHLPAYFSDVNKRAMLSSPAVCADLLFNETDVSRLLADTQISSSLRSQQALVDVAHGSGARSKRYSPRRSPARPLPSRRCRRESGSPARQGKRVRFDSPALLP